MPVAQLVTMHDPSSRNAYRTVGNVVVSPSEYTASVVSEDRTTETALANSPLATCVGRRLGARIDDFLHRCVVRAGAAMGAATAECARIAIVRVGDEGGATGLRARGRGALSLPDHAARNWLRNFPN